MNTPEEIDTFVDAQVVIMEKTLQDILDHVETNMMEGE